MNNNTNIPGSNSDIPNSPIEPLQETAAEVKELQDKVDAKLGEKCPEELESHENVLFHEISSTVIKILTDKATSEAFKSLSAKLDNVDISKELVELLATTVTFATYNAIAFYDTTVKEKISENFREIGNVVMKQGSDIEVLQLKVGDIEKKQITSKIQDMVDSEK